MGIAPLIDYKIRKALYPVIITGIITGIFMCLILSHWHYLTFIISFLIGATVFIILYSFSDYFFRWLTRELNLLLSTLLLSVFYLLVIITTILFYMFLSSLGNLSDFNQLLYYILISDVMWYGVTFGLAVSLIMNFLFTVNTIIGSGLLGNLLIGKYMNPKTEHRFFLFLDIKSSTKIAEDIGPKSFLGFLNEFYFDVSEPVILSKGLIYKYVGDEIIITWRHGVPGKNDEILNCFFRISKIVSEKSKIYQRKYGYTPQFRASLHFGEVVTGEMGYLKKEITYLGDVLNTSSRIHEVCKETGHDYIISAAASIQLGSDINNRSVDLGETKLRGKSQKVRLFAINKINNSD